MIIILMVCIKIGIDVNPSQREKFKQHTESIQ
jgi:hypothetical protein